MAYFKSKSLLKNIIYKFSIFLFISAIINVPICDLSCEFLNQNHITAHQCHHITQKEQNNPKYDIRKHHHQDIFCSFLHPNADEYLKLSIFLFFIPTFSLKILVAIIKNIDFKNYHPISHTIPKFILYCSQLK